MLRFAIEISLLERQGPARLLPGGSKKLEDCSEESLRGAPGGDFVAALILRFTPTLSPNSEPKPWTSGSEYSDPIVLSSQQAG